MSEPRGPWVIHESTVVYADPWIQVRLDRVTRPDGRAGTHTLTTIKPGVCVIALDEDGSVWLTEEFHYAVGRTTLEGVSGGARRGSRRWRRLDVNWRRSWGSWRSGGRTWVGAIRSRR